MSLSLYFHHKYCLLLQVLGSSCDKTLTIWDLQKQQPKYGEFIIVNYIKSLHNLYQIIMMYDCYHFHFRLKKAVLWIKYKFEIVKRVRTVFKRP